LTRLNDRPVRGAAKLDLTVFKWREAATDAAVDRGHY